MRRIIIITTISIICLTNSIFGQDFSVTETNFKSDSLTLFADIYTPNETNKKIGIALIQGSGNSDRTNLWAKSFAEILAENGYYVLLPDKRGSGKSEGSWKNSSFNDLSTDVIASIHHLKSLMKLDAVGVMGLSQGGFIAPIAASQDTTIKFVIDIVGAAVTLEEQIVHEVTNTAIKEGLKPNEIKEVLDLHVLMKQYAFDRNWTPLEKRFAELDSSNWSAFAKTFPSSPNIWVWDWIKLNIEFNPMDYWEKVNQAVFVAYGSKDQNDNMPVYESAYRLQKGFKSIGKANYVINIYETGHAMYEDDKAEIRKEFIEDLLNWLKNNGN
ncbi:MAG: alpha/beta fold hydrolase [Balneolaceae bacterium]